MIPWVQVLHEFSHLQWHPSRLKGQRSLPCTQLKDAAGLEGPRSQQAACHAIHQSALRRIQAAGFDMEVTARLQDSISLHNIACSAENIIMLPELLYIPSELESFLADSSEYGETNKLKHDLLKMCVVISPRIKLNYHHLWDMDKLHQQHVRTVLHVSRFWMSQVWCGQNMC